MRSARASIRFESAANMAIFASRRARLLLALLVVLGTATAVAASKKKADGAATVITFATLRNISAASQLISHWSG